MKACELQPMLSREWQEQGRFADIVLTPESRFITGNVYRDAQLNRVINLYGIELEWDTRFNEIKSYRVIDEQKFLLFVLRWS
jgi:hypothetical protein